MNTGGEQQMRKILSTIQLLTTIALLLSGRCYAEEINVSDYTQSRIGMIQGMDYASRTAVISGYRYSFSGVKGYDHPDVRLHGSKYGSFTLLNVGMTVKVVYRLSEKSRVVVDLQQVANGTRLGIPYDAS
jgi:hypothetical protein